MDTDKQLVLGGSGMNFSEGGTKFLMSLSGLFFLAAVAAGLSAVAGLLWAGTTLVQWLL
jgi:hypothetical protein